MSRRMDGLALGDTMWFKGPKGRFNYMPNMKQHIGTHTLLCLVLTAADEGCSCGKSACLRCVLGESKVGARACLWCKVPQEKGEVLVWV